MKSEGGRGEAADREYSLRDRLMVGLLPLEQCILVRIQVPQPRKESAPEGLYSTWQAAGVLREIARDFLREPRDCEAILRGRI